jgi:hypothetical protein
MTDSLCSPTATRSPSLRYTTCAHSARDTASIVQLRMPPRGVPMYRHSPTTHTHTHTHTHTTRFSLFVPSHLALVVFVRRKMIEKRAENSSKPFSLVTIALPSSSSPRCSTTTMPAVAIGVDSDTMTETMRDHVIFVRRRKTPKFISDDLRMFVLLAGPNNCVSNRQRSVSEFCVCFSALFFFFFFFFFFCLFPMLFCRGASTERRGSTRSPLLHRLDSESFAASYAKRARCSLCRSQFRESTTQREQPRESSRLTFVVVS